MPGSINNANPSTVLPDSLSSAFVVSREWLAQMNAYRNGETQVALRVAAPRSSWPIQKRLAPTELAALRTFYLARKGGTESFYFYDLLTHPTAAHDPTGVATLGRYIVRFVGTLDVEHGMARSVVPIALVEVA